MLGADPNDASHNRSTASRRSEAASPSAPNSPRPAHAGSDRRGHVGNAVRTAADAGHVERIGDGHAIEAELAAQHVGHDVP